MDINLFYVKIKITNISAQGYFLENVKIGPAKLNDTMLLQTDVHYYYLTLAIQLFLTVVVLGVYHYYEDLDNPMPSDSLTPLH